MSGMPTAADAAEAMRATLRDLAAFSRVPFRKLLAELLGGAPTPEAIAIFAAKYPDKWAAAVSIFAGLAGFEKGLVSLNVYNIGSMSDVQVLAELARGDEELAKLGLRRPPVTIDAASTEVLAPVGETAGGTLPNALGATGDNAQENRREAPPPSAANEQSVNLIVERDSAGDVVNPAGGC